MAKKNFLLLSMEDSKIKKISNVISNESCRKILDYLADKESSESEIAEKLNIPISTVHYNLQQLVDAGLVSADEFHYSKKGKEISHYKLANKYIVIAPKNTFGIKEKLKNIFPAVLIASGAALILQYLSKPKIVSITQPAMMAKSFAQESSIAAAPMMADTAQSTIISSSSLSQSIALWFFIGAAFALVAYLIINSFKKNN